MGAKRPLGPDEAERVIALTKKMPIKIRDLDVLFPSTKRQAERSVQFVEKYLNAQFALLAPLLGDVRYKCETFRVKGGVFCFDLLVIVRGTRERIAVLEGALTGNDAWEMQPEGASPADAIRRIAEVKCARTAALRTVVSTAG